MDLYSLVSTAKYILFTITQSHMEESLLASGTIDAMGRWGIFVLHVPCQ